MTADQRPSFVALAAALRTEFNDLQLEALWIQMREHRYDLTSLGTLAQAVHNAHDIAYRTSQPGQLGPYHSERDTYTTPLLVDTGLDTPEGGVYSALNRIALLTAIRDAGVKLGDFDVRVVEWLCGLEPSTVQVVIGLIGRAHEAGLNQREGNDHD
jgi:hypothetical protein